MMTLFAILGATENAEVENAALEKAAPDNMGGKRGSRQHRG